MPRLLNLIDNYEDFDMDFLQNSINSKIGNKIAEDSPHPEFNMDEIYIHGKYLNTTELIRRRGFGYETYKVVTKDGMVLQLTRIVTGKVSSYLPVLLQHGLLASSDQWIMCGRKKDLPFILADNGFDVWLGDQRGNANSRSHVNYTARDPRMWNFGLHESAINDLPAFIDTIISVTGAPKLNYIGHSMGTTVFLIMASLMEDYGQRVQIAVLLAPVAYAPKRTQSVIIRGLLKNADAIVDFVMKYKIKEFLPRMMFNIQNVQRVCDNLPQVCMRIYGDLYGENYNNINKTMLGYYYSSLPAGTSVHTVIHLSQIFRSGRFQQYDYGVIENLKRYSETSPPLYPVNKITTPVALIYGINDAFLSKQTIHTLANVLPNVILQYEVPDPKFNHIDFLFGINARSLVHSKIVRLLQQNSRLG